LKQTATGRRTGFAAAALMMLPMVFPFSAVGLTAADSTTRRTENVSASLPSTGLTTRDRVIGEHLFGVGYSKIAEIYLNPLQTRRLALDGLGGLRQIEPGFAFLATDTLLTMSVEGRPVPALPLPASDSTAAWATLTIRVLDSLRQASVRAAAAAPEELYTAIFNAIATDLDSYSRYTSAARANDERSQREGYGGVGIALRQDGSSHVITEVLADGPASQAGILAGDRIVSVDGIPTAALNSEQVGERLRGPAGTLVTLQLQRGPAGDGYLKPQTIRRDRLIPNTVQVELSDGVAIVRIERFNAATKDRLQAAILQLREGTGPAPVGVVLDLRGNPGGLLDQAVAVADQFMTGGRIVSTRGRHPDSLQQFDASPDDLAGGLPLVVLLDGRTASSAEIVAAALQDSGRAVSVGSSTYGKGSVQTVTRLPNDGELFLTWSRIYTPGGYTLHRQGVQPIVCTSLESVNATQDALRALRAGTMVPASTLRDWKARAPDDETALAHLREACPWREHAPELDIAVAKVLIHDGALYRRAQILSQPSMAER
jgi:carboxyl-terminal processing protease